MSPGADYLQRSRQLVDTVQSQMPEIRQVSRWFAESILAGRVVHLFGSGHSRILVEEMWPRYGSFPGFNPIVELSLTNHNGVVGTNGQRQAMFLENVPGFAARILRNFDLSPRDTALVASSSGCNIVPIEMAEEFQRRGVKVVAIISRQHSDRTPSRRADGRKLQDFADLVLDTGAPAGDAMVKIEGLETPVSPGSTIGGCLLVNTIKAEVAARLTQAGQPPKVLTAPALIGRDRAVALFEAAYDEHGRRLARLYEKLGLEGDGGDAPKAAPTPAPAPVQNLGPARSDAPDDRRRGPRRPRGPRRDDRRRNDPGRDPSRPDGGHRDEPRQDRGDSTPRHNEKPDGQPSGYPGDAQSYNEGEVGPGNEADAPIDAAHDGPEREQRADDWMPAAGRPQQRQGGRGGGQGQGGGGRGRGRGGRGGRGRGRGGRGGGGGQGGGGQGGGGGTGF